MASSGDNNSSHVHVWSSAELHRPRPK